MKMYDISVKVSKKLLNKAKDDKIITKFHHTQTNI